MRLRPTPKTYDELVKAFRIIGKNDYSQAARLANTVPTIAKRAWLTGWPSEIPTDPPMPAIKDMFERQVFAARAARAKATKSLMQKQAEMLNAAQDDAAQQRAIEGMAARSIMVTVDAFASQMLQLSTVFPKLQKKINALIEEMMNDEEVPLSRMQQVITWAVTNMDMLTKAMEKAQTIERKFLGDADATVKIVDGRTPEERISGIMTTLLSLKDAGKLPALPSLPNVIDVEKTEAAGVLAKFGRDDTKLKNH
jgi:hypothetical protein